MEWHRKDALSRLMEKVSGEEAELKKMQREARSNEREQMRNRTRYINKHHRYPKK